MTAWLVKHRICGIIVWAVMAAAACLGLVMNNASYDFFRFLPAELKTVKGSQMLLDGFGEGAVCLVTTQNLTETEQTELKRKIGEIGHVSSVLDYAGLSEDSLPVQVFPGTMKIQFTPEAPNGNMLVFLDGLPSSESTLRAVQSLKELVGERGDVSGLPVRLGERMLLFQKRVLWVFLAFGGTCLLLLFLTGGSFVLPLAEFLAAVLGIVCTTGSRALMGQMNAFFLPAALLPGLLTISNAVFLWKAYQEKKLQTEDADLAMCQAVSSVPMIRSGLIGIVASLVLCIMPVLRELGFLLAIGMVFSTLVSWSFCPCLLRLLSGWAEQTEHKSLFHRSGMVSRFVLRHLTVLLVCFCLLLIPAGYGFVRPPVNGTLSEADASAGEVHLLVCEPMSSEELQRVTDAAERVAGVRQLLNLRTLTNAAPTFLSQNEGQNRLERILPERLLLEADPETDLDAVLACFGEHETAVLDVSSLDRDVETQGERWRVLTFAGLGLGLLFVLIILFHSVILPVLQTAFSALCLGLTLVLAGLLPLSLPWEATLILAVCQSAFFLPVSFVLLKRYRDVRTGTAWRREAVRLFLQDSAEPMLVVFLTICFSCLAAGLCAAPWTGSLLILLALGSVFSLAAYLFLLPPLAVVLDRLIVSKRHEEQHS